MRQHDVVPLEESLTELLIDGFERALAQNERITHRHLLEVRERSLG